MDSAEERLNKDAWTEQITSVPTYYTLYAISSEERLNIHVLTQKITPVSTFKQIKYLKEYISSYII
jgi:hypothetical protein